MSGVPLSREQVIGVDITTGNFGDQLAAMVALAAERRSSYVCCANVHMVVEAWKDPDFARVVNEADLATPDGMPIVRSLQWLHGIRQERVAGNDLMPAIMADAEQRSLSVYLFGGEQRVLEAIKARAASEFPRLVIAGHSAPSFRPWTDQEMIEQARNINDSKAHFVLVSLGCPKQEKWMAAMRGRVNAAMIGLGGAFLLFAGEDTRAPRWMRDLSLEWAYRLWLEPRRLWKRYLVTNTVFIGLFAREALRSIFRSRPGPHRTSA